MLLQKPRYHHAEVYNDNNNDLVNFWLCMRDHAEAMQARLASLPYARSLFYSYQHSLYDGMPLENIERAVRWFYVVRCSFLPVMRKSPQGWSTGPGKKAAAYASALRLFTLITERLRLVEIDNRDFAWVIARHQSPRTLLYVDPPYLEVKDYYQSGFALADHKRLASVLNATPAYVALSYYQHPLLDELYPASRWRRIVWRVPKHSQRTRSVHDRAQEMLLMNYPEPDEEPQGCD